MITKSVLFSVFMAATTTTANPGRIVNGTDAEPGDYPYFVNMGYGCVGTLIAPDMVLFAAHCKDFKDEQLHVGAFQATTVTEGSQIRHCAEWKQDPKFGTEGSIANYDFALCRLDEPVFIDESNVKLELNDNDAVPREDKNLIAIGIGALTEFGDVSSLDVLQDVKVPAMTNNQCKQYYIDLVMITDNMLCTGFPEGGNGPCRGDGPLVRRKKNNDGTFTDIHVGVISFGKGCGGNNPAVYARTSKRIDWIKETSCSMGSIAAFCNNPLPPTPGPCNKDLTIKVTTDQYGVETTWKLRDSNKEEIMKRSYLVSFYENEHTLCLKSDECYQFLIEDSFGDGMCLEGPETCGSYSLDLNGQEITSALGDFTDERKFEFCTGDGVPNFCDDDDDDEFEFKFKPNKTCENWVGVGNKKKIKKKCGKYFNGQKVFKWCPETCKEVGLGPCAS